jgi:phospholipid/cholesterol/gamma-HCH transport system substrate-binding protein
MMNDQIKAFWLGLFIVIALVLLAWLVLFLKPGVGDGQVKLQVRFSNIDKISVGTRVTFAGKPVGEVVDIREIPNPRKAPADASRDLYIYQLTLKVDSSVTVFNYDKIIFATSGLLGEKSIAIVPRAPAPGEPPAHNVTNEVLYAQSTDKIEQMLNQFAQVATTFENTLAHVNTFLENNGDQMSEALKNLSLSTHALHLFLERANTTDVIHQVSEASEMISRAMTEAEDFFVHVNHSEGSLHRLIHSDCLYVQLTTVLCELHSVLDTIRNYGLLYQFDRKWQRMHDAQIRGH